MSAFEKIRGRAVLTMTGIRAVLGGQEPAPGLTLGYGELRLAKLREDQRTLHHEIERLWSNAGSPSAARDVGSSFYHAYAWARVQVDGNGRPHHPALLASMWKDYEGRITEAEHWLGLLESAERTSKGNHVDCIG